ncbi:MAG: single-stranded-DNA-specific exonuclease RecJ [Anaerovoracaceae bacterium]|jgi:single-stranded-DNA-specific exonuclease
MKHKWIFTEKQQNIDELIHFILEQRGVTDKVAREEFLSEKPQLTYDPFMMKDIEEAAQRILEAIEAEQEICIYGDYDADGVCAVSLLFEILTKLSAKISYYIPSRFDEGYGLNNEAIQVIRKRGVDLIVTVDCGSVSIEEIKYAKEIGLDIIVTDHHNIKEKELSCLLINPKQEDCPYPEQELSGCGVAFKLAQTLQRKVNPDNEKNGLLTKKDLNGVLDLIAIATVGDIVPLLGENRTFVKYGIRTINSGKRPGLAKLINGIGLNLGEIISDKIAYAIVPHLNAAGRMLTAETGVTLLISKDDKEVEKAAELLIENNKERRRIQEETFKETLVIVEKYHRDDPVLIVNAENAHEGIAGIVAGKLKDRYYRPTILVTPSGEDDLKGTGRSIDGINLYEMLSECHSLFEKFGGHEGACGFLMKRKNLPDLREILLSSGKRLHQSNPLTFEPKLYIDGEVTPEDINFQLINTIKKLEPFGHKNPRPIFCLRGLTLNKPVYMGKRQQHVRFYASDLPCILFNRAEEYRKLLDRGIIADLAGYPEINYWNGNEKIQFVVSDIRCYNDKNY